MKKQLLIFAVSVLFVLMISNCSTPSKILHSDKVVSDKLEINKTGDALDKIVFLTFDVSWKTNIQHSTISSQYSSLERHKNLQSKKVWNTTT